MPADGTEFSFLSANLLHIADRTMSMLPFATKTDLVEALKRADCKLSEVEEFLNMLNAEHNTPAARTQLKTLWTKYIEGRYGAPHRDGPGSGHGAAPVRLSKATTPPASPRAASPPPAGAE